MSGFITFWRYLLARDRVERDLDDELQAAFELLVAEKLRAGLTLGAARRAARLELGAIESLKDQVRDVRSGAFLDTLLQDARYGARLLRRNPLFALTAALSIAIGIGATTAIFTIGNGLLLRSAEGVANHETLVDVVRSDSGDGPGVSLISYPDYLEVRRRTRTLDHVFASQLMLSPANLEFHGTTERIFPTAISTHYFRALGVRPAAGILFNAGGSEEAVDSAIAVLSHRYWSRRYAADPSVIGQTVRINGYPLTVVGVAPESFRGTSVGAPDLWVPLGMITVLEPEFGAQMLKTRDAEWLMLSARLKPGVSRARASTEIKAIGAALARENVLPPQVGPGASEAPGSYDWSAQVSSPVPYGLRTLAAGFLTVLIALISVLPVIACANVAGVLIARAAARCREIGVRVPPPD